VSARAWAGAVFAVFIVNGFGAATWMSRIPAMRDQLDVPVSQVGILLAAVSGGAILGLLTASPVVRRFGGRLTILVALSAMGLTLALTGLATTVLQSFPLAVLGMGLIGFTAANSDIAMNIEGAEAERAVGRSLMPWFHGSWSLGTIGAGVLGSAAAFLAVPVAVHFAVAGAALIAVAFLAARSLPAATGADSAHAEPLTRRERLAIWRDPRTLLIGVLVLGMAFAEGSSNDWLALALIDERGFEHGTAALMFTTFAVSMTLGRLIGAPLIDRLGRVPMLIGSALLAIVGLLLVMLVPVAWVTVAGVVIWGLGASLGFPVGMSAAADDPRTAPTRVAVVSVVGYSAFLVGPPVLGFIGEHIGLLSAYWITLGLIVLAAIAAPAAREPARRRGAATPPLLDDPRIAPHPSTGSLPAIPTTGSSSDGTPPSGA